MNEDSASTGEPIPPPQDKSIRDSFADLVATGRDLAQAELDWAKVKGGIVATALCKGAIFGGLALFLGFIGLLLLVVAAVIALAVYVGSLWATLIVALTAFVLAALLGLLAKGAVASAVKDGE